MSFELTILGSNSALPTSNRYPTAQVLEVPGRCFLIDCGEGTQIQLRRNKISFSKIQHIFISHLHGDHYFGLIGLLSTMNLLGVKSDVHIYAPSELKALIKPQLDFIRGEMSINPVFHPLNQKKPQTIFENKNVEVLSFPVKHSIPTLGFLFREKQKQANIKKEMITYYNIPLAKIKDIKAGADFVTEEGKLITNEKLTIPAPKPKSYAFCTDTAFHPPIAEIIDGVDMLYHEATFLEELKDLAEKTLHSTARQAAEMAKLSKASKLLIGHFSSRFKKLDDFKNEAREVFENTELATEGKKYVI
ncbi:ribonuclease Z [Draconibacterium halophilum]|uniref:Ribonuclease Z n=1 Tax=Draconibacterium halophilum TaxID=2706887 RepID=A0A6C0RDH4_9BACT|nr:ribonuclease Z [Draconibacterium halophilum]QIA07795.1 ribonuclease Z [Draconibacterium halophilum]